MSLAMSKAQRESFLAATHVAIVSIADTDRGPLTVPVWYGYEPGGLARFVTGGGSQKARLIRRMGRLSLCVQTETPPYQYVSVEGPVTIGVPDFDRDIRAMAYRYLGAELGEMYLRLTADERANNILVCLQPERWLTVDYSKMG